tara:strand:- start:151 stop:342 length:192 start_codon:yes stop_codon:yes gene_type:complete
MFHDPTSAFGYHAIEPVIARESRIEFAGVHSAEIHRVNHKDWIFKKEAVRRSFLKQLNSFLKM